MQWGTETEFRESTQVATAVILKGDADVLNDLSCGSGNGDGKKKKWTVVKDIQEVKPKGHGRILDMGEEGQQGIRFAPYVSLLQNWTNGDVIH